MAKQLKVSIEVTNIRKADDWYDVVFTIDGIHCTPILTLGKKTILRVFCLTEEEFEKLL